MSDVTLSEFDQALTQMIVDKGLATREDIQDCLELHAHLATEGDRRSLSDFLIGNQLLTPKQLERIRQQIAGAAAKPQQQIPGYQIVGKLGAGAMASVFKARQVSLDRMVAVKVMPQKFMSDPQFVERFYSEGRAAAKLNHPNIVQAIDVGQTPEFHYFVMEYVEGTTAYDYLESHPHYEEAEALRIIIMIAKALDHAHSQGFMHRDVKPKNIMITREGIAKLADMGLARQVADTEAAESEAGRAYGTPYYISPEQVRGETNVDFRADIYGLGCTFYHMVTGRVPFDGANPSTVMHKHLTQEAQPADHVNPKLSAGVSEIIEVMMAKRQEDRYTTTKDLLEDLMAVARGDSPSQARKKFNVASLASIEDGQSMSPHEQGAAGGGGGSEGGITASPLFPILIVSLLANLALLGWMLLR